MLFLAISLEIMCASHYFPMQHAISPTGAGWGGGQEGAVRFWFPSTTES